MLTFASIMTAAGIDPADALVIRHTYVPMHDDGLVGIHADSTDDEILEYTRQQSAVPGNFPAIPPPLWLVFIRDGGDAARLWAVVRNHGEVDNDGPLRTFDLEVTDDMDDLRDRLVVGWKAPIAWRVRATTAASYPVKEIADAAPIPFPGFDELIVDYPQLQEVVREHRYGAWRTTLASVAGIYLITDTRDGRHYVGKADGEENILQRWTAYAANGHGGNVELRNLDPTSFRFSLLRVFDPSTPQREINAAESHFKNALDSRNHGLNRG